MRKLILSALLAGSLSSQAQTLLPAIPIHDPVLTRQNGTYYLFGTGTGVTVWSSKDRRTRPRWCKAARCISTPATTWSPPSGALRDARVAVLFLRGHGALDRAPVHERNGWYSLSYAAEFPEKTPAP